MRGSRGVGGGGGVRTPLEFAKLNIADITGNEKIIFHICALPQLYVKQNQSYLRLDPPWKNFLDPRLRCYGLASAVLRRLLTSSTQELLTQSQPWPYLV